MIEVPRSTLRWLMGLICECAVKGYPFPDF